MYAKTRRGTARASTFLQSLRRDPSGNTIAMMAVFMIPLTILAGSAVDISRQFLVKSRLQQACDAGVLAGRKFMTATSGTALDADPDVPTAANRANEFFVSNFRANWMGTTAVSFTATRTSDSQVTGTATATVPMTITKMFNTGPSVVNVACTARFDIGDTDVMFVLDTTGSMACLPSDSTTSGCGQSPVSYTRPDGTTGYKVTEKSGSRIAGLRSAVLNFYDTIASQMASTAKVRYGFVNYSSTVNAGYSLPAGHLVDSWEYDSRQLNGDANNGSISSVTYSNVSNSTCNSYVGRSPATGYNTDGRADVKTRTSFSGTASVNGTCIIATQPVKPNWNYTNVTYDTSQFKLGTTVTDPSKVTGATSKWQGCLEERNTTAGASTFSLSSLPSDLDPDLVPSSTATRWRPMWPDVIYYRPSSAASNNISGNSTTVYGDETNNSATDDYTNMLMTDNISKGYVACGKPVKRLGVMTRTEVSNYVNAADFVAQGGTYHDIGMIWGTRMISPFGLFASDTAAWPGNNPPARFIVFMTDGDMAPNGDSYGMYGIEDYDSRVKGSSSTALKDLHNARFAASCSAAKARNITVFVVAFGQALTTELTNCASPGSAFYASSTTALNNAFNSIAQNVAALRLSQ